MCQAKKKEREALLINGPFLHADADIRLRPARSKVVYNEIVNWSVNKFK